MTRNILTLLILISVALPAAAERIALTEVRLLKTAQALREQVEQQLRNELEAMGHELLAAEQLKLHSVAIRSCRAGPCLQTLGRELNVDWVITGAVTALGSSYDLTLTLQETRGGSVAAQVRRRCDVCTYSDVSKAVAQAARSLGRRAARYFSARSLLVLQSDPPGATVQLDGLVIGQTPLQRYVAPGPHALVLDKSSLTRTRSVRLEAGERHELKVRLGLSLPGDKPTPSETRRVVPAWVGWSVSAMGVAAVAIGATFWALEGQCEDEVCRTDRLTAGIGLVGGGLAVTSTGAFLLYLSQRKMVVSAGVVPGGAQALIVGRF